MKIIELNTDQEKIMGMQNIQSLAPNVFLLFKNISPGTYFHTRNCHIDLDIIAIDEQGRVLAYWIASPGISGIGPMPLGTKHVVETRGGWMKKKDVSVGKNLLALLG